MLHLTRLFELECEGEHDGDLLYGDSLSLALLLRLSRLGRSQCHSRPHGGLSPIQLRTATEYLSSDLGAEVSLRDLADITRLSRSYFCRAFRVSIGMPPHQWRLRAKVHKVQELLLDGTLTLADIALATGFSDQAHLTRAFKRYVGATPAAWRREKNK
ncbi:helix-turn-helix transcriptional regulator [Paraburkholderia xenovorans]|uniref:helix-turn-helix transcriptional regulator n=1 Tax=Paraburkholderia xenovorans TaxID=36873 RepID=UPI0038BB5B7D